MNRSYMLNTKFAKVYHDKHYNVEVL